MEFVQKPIFTTKTLTRTMIKPYIENFIFEEQNCAIF